MKQILPKLRLYARARTFSSADADDLVSDTCVRLLEKEAAFRRDGNLMAWAAAILRNLQIDKARAEARRGPRLMLVGGEIDPLSEKAIEDRLHLNQVHRLIQGLPEEQREVLMLRGGGFAYDEIAATLDIPRGTMMSRLHRARNALQALLEEKEKVTA